MADARSQTAARRERGFLRDPVTLALLWCFAVSLIFLLFPGIDLWATGLFYDPAAGFPAGSNAVLKTLRASMDAAIVLVVAVLFASLVLKLARPDRPSLVPPSASLFLLSSLALGPGLLVNVVLKDHWGRPRPVMTEAFGGSLPYVEVWRVTDYCSRNCSFVGGEASSAIWLTAVALVVPARWRPPVLLVTGLYAAAISLNRIAFGRHFLSDVLLAWGLTALVMAVLYRLLIADPPAALANPRLESALTRLGQALRRPFGG